jgi:hypothetical protein
MPGVRVKVKTGAATVQQHGLLGLRSLPSNGPSNGAFWPKSCGVLSRAAETEDVMHNGHCGSAATTTEPAGPAPVDGPHPTMPIWHADVTRMGAITTINATSQDMIARAFTA